MSKTFGLFARSLAPPEGAWPAEWHVDIFRVVLDADQDADVFC